MRVGLHARTVHTPFHYIYHQVQTRQVHSPYFISTPLYSVVQRHSCCKCYHALIFLLHLTRNIAYLNKSFFTALAQKCTYVMCRTPFLRSTSCRGVWLQTPPPPRGYTSLYPEYIHWGTTILTLLRKRRIWILC